MENKWVYEFSRKKTDGSKELKGLLGGKGANLAEMSSLGINVPPGFTITTEACLDFEKAGSINAKIKEEVLRSITNVEKLSGKKFGDPLNPLLFSVRSGAQVSMPGMMDTVLNLGLCEKSLEGLIQQTSNERFAWDSYRRFIQMFSNVVLGFNTSIMDSLLEDLKDAREVLEDTELSASDLKELCEVYKSVILNETGVSFPNDPYDQLWLSVEAVFKSWNNKRAIKYREINNFSHDWGTAVNIQSMVFGNMGADCATGVCFTRDPSTGQKRFFGEYLINAQGEDVVAGIRTPAPINDESKNNSNSNLKTLQEMMPKVFDDLESVYKQLEAHYKDMQDIEFTVENNQLFILQTRSGKRTAAAAIKIVVDFVSENLLTKEEAILRVDPESLNQLLHPILDPTSEKKILTSALPASPGAASGEICFNSEDAKILFEKGHKVILVRQETSPEDIVGMVSSVGILTSRGGMTSHAAVVARGMGKPCVVGCSSAIVSYLDNTLNINGEILHSGDYLTIDGATGEVFKGEVGTISAEISSEFKLFMSWADEFKKLEVRTNADNFKDCAVALGFGAEGVGLCRTEHMFFDPERILSMRKMIFAKDIQSRKLALEEIIPFQMGDFFDIFKVMNGKNVNIRLLDPPLHEFLPHTKTEKMDLAKSLNISLDELNIRAQELHEFNPMLGHRGCRLAISYPEICIMQSKAIARAASKARKENIPVNVEIMVPLISDVVEFEFLKKIILKEIESEIESSGFLFHFKIGTMIELPRAAITAANIAAKADFFSFGTNDLTQTTYGLSRDDSGKFLKEYIKQGLFLKDPFVSLDQEGVGFLIEHATKAGKSKKPEIHMGICGEHGGDPDSISFCHKIGLDYVSCSPFRVPIARLAAAQVAIRH